MTALEHNKFLGIAHLVYAAFHLLMMVMMVAFMGTMMSQIFNQARRMGDTRSTEFIPVMLVFVGAVQLILSIPPIVAGYAFLKRRHWAKVAGITAGIVAAMSFPIGTALAVYTFWFLFSDASKPIYGPPLAQSPPPPPNWQ